MIAGMPEVLLWTGQGPGRAAATPGSGQIPQVLGIFHNFPLAALTLTEAFTSNTGVCFFPFISSVLIPPVVLRVFYSFRLK